LQDAARLFDLFMASHPLMPLYLGAAAMCAMKGQLLECEVRPLRKGAAGVREWVIVGARGRCA